MDESRRNLTALVACVLAVAGCAAVREPIDRPSPRPLGRELRSIEATDPAGATRTPSPNPAGVITLRDALALALANSPRLAAFSWEARVREANALQAGLPPNPEIRVELENFAGSGRARGFDASESTLWLSQLVELGGKRTKRRNLADLELAVAGWDYEAARIETFTDVSVAFVDVLAAQRRKTLAEDLVGVAERALRIVGDQVSAGAVSSVERSRAEVSLASSRLDLARRTRELESARRRLAATWGSANVRFTAAAGALDEGIEPLPSEAALLREVGNNPDLTRWTAEMAAHRALVALEESRRIPDVTLGGGPRWLADTSDNAFVFELSVPLPLFDRNQGGSLAAQRRLAKASEERRAVEVEVEMQLGTAYQSLAATFDTVLALRRELLPRARQAFEGATAAYRRGVFRYVDVLDAQRTLFALRSEYVDSLAAYHAAVARLERLVGRPLAEIRDEEGRS